MVEKKFISFEEALLHFMSEWDYEKNFISPKDISCKSKERIWFVCSEGHSFVSSPIMRLNGSKCKKCGANERALLKRKQNPLTIKHQDIFKDWDSSMNKEDMFSVSIHAKSPFWWTCNHGHSYQVSLFSRIRSNGCKICNFPKKASKIREARLMNSTSFAVEYPELAKEWDYLKNRIKPGEVSKKSNIKVWFKCGKGHEFESTPKRRVASTGCPVCVRETQGERIMEWKLKKAGVSLAEKFPELIHEWDYSKNNLDPYKVTPNSGKKVSWKCRFGHIWDASINNRTANNSGCPNCRSMTSKLEVFVLCELRQLFHEVEWRSKIDGYECDILIKDINVGVEVDGAFWHADKLQRDREKLRVFNKNGIELLRIRSKELPEIEGRVVKYDKQSEMVILVSSLLKHIEDLHTGIVFKDYHKNQEQIGEKEYKKILSLLPSPTEANSLKMVNPELSKEWHPKKNQPLTAEMFSPNSEMKVWWGCHKNHEWQASIKNRHKRNSGCPFCYKLNAGDIVRKAILDKRGISFGDKSPELLKEWDFVLNKRSPYEISPGSSLKTHWKCEKGHSWMAQVGARTGRGDGCPVCYNLNRGEKLRESLLLKGGVSFGEKHPNLLKEWDFEINEKSPIEFSPNSGVKVNWKCQNGHQWMATINSRATGIGNCQKCKSIVMTNPELLNEWDYKKNTKITPEDVKAGSSKIKVWWTCLKHGSYAMSVSDKVNRIDCPTCSKAKKIESYKQNILKKRGSLHSNRPELLKYWDYEKNIGNIDPRNVTVGSYTVVWWKCENDHSWLSKIITMTDKRKKSICKFCG